MPWISGNYYMSGAATINNADIIHGIFQGYGWTENAICAMLGNIQGESGCNPGVWENLTPYWRGYGLTQWSPYTKYSNWATSMGYLPWEDNGDAECERIHYETTTMPPTDPDYPWFYNSEIGMYPPITLPDFTTSTLPLNTLTNYWLWFYEHPLDPGPTTQATRQSYAQAWWNRYNGGQSTLPPWLLKKLSDSWRR